MAEQSGPEPFSLKPFAWRWRQALIGLAVGAALLALTMERAPMGAILASLRALDSSWALLALLAYAADLGLRVIRWRLLFAKVATAVQAVLFMPLVLAALALALAPQRLQTCVGASRRSKVLNSNANR